MIYEVMNKPLVDFLPSTDILRICILTLFKQSNAAQYVNNNNHEFQDSMKFHNLLNDDVN